MKKAILSLIGILALLTSNAQTTKDTVTLDGEKIGYIDYIDSSRGFEGSLTTIYNINLFRDLLADEKYALVSMYNPMQGQPPYIKFQQEVAYSLALADNVEVNLNYEYDFKTNSAKAGHLLFEAGKLNTQSKTIYIAAGLVAITGMLASNYINRDVGTSTNINGMVTTNPPNQSLAIFAISSSGIMSIVALAKSYKADKKIKQAGVLLQKK